MADDPKNIEAQAEETQQQIGNAGGAYEVLRARLTEQCKSLRTAVDKLNARRKDVFGRMETNLAGASRILSENNCVPRDIIHLGQKLIFGYDVFLGMKKEPEVSDVLSVYAFDGAEFKNLGIDFLADPGFVRDFKELYRYFKEPRLLQVRNTGTHLLLVFQTGASQSDYRVFRWILNPDGSVQYIDCKGERDHAFPAQFDFKWTRVTRDQHVMGKYPHISIEDKVYVECVGGDLTLKVEDNTESGQGIFAEPVDDKNQSLGDALIDYAVLNNLVLLRIQPFGEQQRRHIIFSRLTQKARRVDSIRQACIQLPEGHGVIFPGGYFLQTGECKEFNEDVSDMEFFKTIRSPNGEDVMYIFYQRLGGRYLLLQYNLIEKDVATPLVCNGFSMFEDGKLVIFKSTTKEPSKSHAVQIWQTPFVGENFVVEVGEDSFLSKVGNKDLVRGISDALTVTKLARESAASTAAYQDLVKQAERVLDTYHWLGHEECFGLEKFVREVRDTGNTIIDEFEKVQSIKKSTSEQIEKFAVDVEGLFRRMRVEILERIDQYAHVLSQLRDRRGRLITLRELRYADEARLQALEDEIVERFAELSKKTVQFLLGKNALKPYTDKLDGILGKIDKISKVMEATPLQAELDELSAGLDLLSEIINNLKIEDATARTEIIESLSEVYSHLNRTRATLASRRKDYLGRELIAEFSAQFKLLSQGVTNYIGLCDTPEKCDEFLTKLLVQVEELEAKFSDFPEYIQKISDKRDEVYDAFSSRKQQLLDERQRKANAMADAAERILKGIARRALSFKSADELNGYFASDPMVLKVRDFIERLQELGDSVKADDMLGKLKTSRQDATRALRDKQEIFEEGSNIIKLGHRRFSVNTQPLDLSLVLRNDQMYYHLTGTDFYHPVDDSGFADTKPFWNQELPSENRRVYRCEYLAWKILNDALGGRKSLDLERLNAASAEDRLLPMIREYSGDLYDEGYERGVHDRDTALILTAALSIRERAGLLRYDPRHRAMACIFWSWFDEGAVRELIERKAQNLGRMRQVFVKSAGSQTFMEQIASRMRKFFQETGVPVEGLNFATAAEYLFYELSQEHNPGVVNSKEASELYQAFCSYLGEKHARRTFEGDLENLQGDLVNGYDLSETWLDAFLAERGSDDARHFRYEVLGMILTRNRLKRATVEALTTARIGGLLGQHQTIQDGALKFRFDEFLYRVEEFARDEVPKYRAYQELKKKVSEAERQRLRLSEFMPKTMSSFVRNKLINDIYLPMVGDNLAKQMGETGNNKRTDLMGMLLLISPPGYGKTTLIEYIANRLGLIFMKINGPALGHGVLSLDPAAAQNATAREEVEKLNLALEMGNNVMIYLDDIQHVNPEFLQKFISLCDAQRKIEGVYKGVTRTYDLRGKKVCVVMAGNPYTESGTRFQIPDMLANRADTYNLGDIIGGSRDAFELSYLENCMTSNPILNPLSTREQKDFYRLVELADGGDVPESDLGHDYSAAELKDIVDVIQKLRKVQQVVLMVNQEYIRSAAQSDDFRTEPPFRLQGSYRDMNKMAAKVLPVLSDEELENLIRDHYNSESQTLTSGAEINLLKLKELRGQLHGKDLERWEDIKRTFRKKQSLLGGDENDAASQVVSQLASFNENLDRIGHVIRSASQVKKDDPLGEKLEQAIAQMGQTFTSAAGSQQQQLAEHLSKALDKVGTQFAHARAQGSGKEEKLEQALLRMAEAVREGVSRRESPGVQQEQQGGGLLTGLSELVDAVRSRESPPIKVVTTMPQYYMNLYEQNIDILRGVLIPLVKGMDEQIRSVDDLHLLLEKVASQLSIQIQKHQAVVSKKAKTKRRRNFEEDSESDSDSEIEIEMPEGGEEGP